MDIVTTIVGNIVGLIFAPVRQEIGYPFSYKSNVDKLRAEVQKLTDDWTDKQRIVDDAKRDNRDIAAAIEGWLKRVTDAFAEANELINKDNEGRGEVRCLKRPFPNLCVRRKLSKDAETMAQKVSEIIAEGRSHQIVFFPVPPQMIDSSSARGCEALESRMSILNEIKQALKDPNINMIGVYGMGGVGKTTLMEELSCLAKTERLFEVVLMVNSITSTPDFRRIQGQLADGLGLELKTETEEGRAGELRGRISNEKSILIILDDIWDELKLGKLGVPYCADRKECKLVLTSRDRDVLRKKMNTQICFPLEVFSEGESWNLFEKIVGDVVKQESINSIAGDVVKCCAGLPLLIDIVAKDLRKEPDVRVWKDTLTRLQSNSGDDKVNDILKLSYERLKQKELKSLFLLMGSFGQVGIGIHTEELLQVCWGLGMYKDVSTLAQARDRQHTLIKGLRASSLLLDGETERVRMHDLVHDVAKLIASETCCTYTGERLTKKNEWPKNDQLQNYHRIILRDYRIRKLPEKLECPNLELLCFIGVNYLKIPNYFFSDMGEKVKVLHLSGMKLTYRLPPSLYCLVGLRSLNLTESMLEDIAIIGELTSLEILILEGAENIKELPKEIGNLTHLRVLNVNGCLKLRVIPKNLLSRLKCLEELYMEHCPIEWEVQGSNNDHNIASLGELRNLHELTALYLEIKDGSIFQSDLHNFEKLERFKISLGPRFVRHGPKVSRTLMLRDGSPTNFAFNDWVKLLLTKVESLHIGELKCVRNIFPEYNGDGFMKLRYLYIERSIELLHIINSSSERHNLNHAFPELETLVLFNLENMEEVCHGPLPAQSFDKLKVIEVSCCHKLKHLLLCSHIRHLSQLHEIKISDCQSMTKIIAKEIHEAEVVVLPELRSLSLKRSPKLLSFCLMPSTDDTGLVPLFDEKVSMPNLETMELDGINTCKIWDDNLPTYSCTQNLTSLEVCQCDGLTSFFPSSVSRALEKLKILSIVACKNLEKIFVQEDISSEEVILPNLETLRLFELDNLMSLWPSQLAPNSYCKLNEMNISQCPRLLNVLPSYVLNSLQNLETLTVFWCDELEVIFEIKEHSTVATNQQGLATRLRTLTLNYLPKLKYIWSKDPHGILKFQSLCNVVVSNSGSLNHVFPISLAKGLQQLERLDIRDSGIENIVEKSESDEIKHVYLEELTLSGCHKMKNIVPSSVVFQNLHELCVSDCGELEVIFEIQEHSTVATNQQGLATRLRTLTLDYLPKLKYIWSKDPHGILKFQSLCNVVVSNSGSLNHVFPISLAKGLQQLERLDIRDSGIENIVEKNESDEIKHVYLEELTLTRCHRLKNIVPSSVVFQNLQRLHVSDFHEVVNIMASSAATNLSELRVLTISSCRNIEEIIASDHDDSDATSEIAFMKLVELRLRHLLRLTSFCKGRKNSFKFPSLERVLVYNCPMMETFCNGNLTAPSLTGVAMGGATLRDQGRWDGDLNTAIANMFTNKVFIEMWPPSSESEDEESSEYEGSCSQLT